MFTAGDDVYFTDNATGDRREGRVRDICITWDPDTGKMSGFADVSVLVPHNGSYVMVWYDQVDINTLQLRRPT